MPLDHSSANVSGLDVDAVRALSSLLQQSADQLRQIGDQINSQMEQTQWNGQDASTYEEQWDSNYYTMLQTLSDNFVEHGQTAERNAADQESTSAS